MGWKTFLVEHEGIINGATSIVTADDETEARNLILNHLSDNRRPPNVYQIKEIDLTKKGVQEVNNGDY